MSRGGGCGSEIMGRDAAFATLWPGFDTQPPTRSAGAVYVLEAFFGGKRFHKIGRSKDPLTRSQLLSIQLPVPADLIGYVPSDEAARLEAECHERYAAQRANGEWFTFDDEDLQGLLCELARYRTASLMVEGRRRETMLVWELISELHADGNLDAVEMMIRAYDCYFIAYRRKCYARLQPDGDLYPHLSSFARVWFPNTPWGDDMPSLRLGLNVEPR